MGLLPKKHNGIIWQVRDQRMCESRNETQGIVLLCKAVLLK